jgi:hypothetical protein
MGLWISFSVVLPDSLAVWIADGCIEPLPRLAVFGTIGASAN